MKHAHLSRALGNGFYLCTRHAPRTRSTWITQTQWVLADIKAGIITSWGRFSGETSGYAITSDLTPQELDAALLKYTPVITFTNRTVISAEESLESIKRIANALQQ